jgi:hypothetical protein
LNTPQTRGNAFEASNYYQYTLDAPASLPDLLRNYSGSGKIEIPTVAVKDLAPVSGYLTLDAFPNPFNPTSQIVFLNPAGGYTTLDVFDILGRKVTTLFAGNVAAGTRQNVKFEAADLSAGLYFAVLRCANQRAVQKMIFSK